MVSLAKSVRAESATGTKCGAFANPCSRLPVENLVLAGDITNETFNHSVLFESFLPSGGDGADGFVLPVALDENPIDQRTGQTVHVGDHDRIAGLHD